MMNRKKSIVLLVDSEADLFFNKTLIAETCNEFQFFTAKTASQAITKIKQISFDLILMNLRMPDMGGIQLTKLIRELNITTPIIGLTHFYLTAELKNFCQEAGLNEVIKRPLPCENIILKQLSLWLELASQKNEGRII